MFNEFMFEENMPERLREFLNYLQTIKGKSDKTILGYKTDLTMFFKYMTLLKGLCPKDASFDEINIQNVDDDFINDIKLSELYSFIAYVQRERDNGTYARARKVASLRSFYRYLYSKAKVIKNNPTAELESPKINKRNPVYLTLDESKSLLNSISGSFAERDYCIIMFFLNCGMRLSELCGIDINKIKDDTLTIIGKGNKERTVYLNSACLKALQNYLPVRNSYGDKVVDKGALFLSKNYRRINQRSVELMVKKYIKLAEIQGDKYSPHKLRHTAATLMYKYGNVDIRSLQMILGHESVSTTQIYTHVDDEKLREAVQSNPLNE